MKYITINNRRKRVDEILEFEEASELDDNVTMLVQEAYINDSLVAGRLIYYILKKKSDYDWELLGAAE